MGGRVAANLFGAGTAIALALCLLGMAPPASASVRHPPEESDRRHVREPDFQRDSSASTQVSLRVVAPSGTPPLSPDDGRQAPIATPPEVKSVNTRPETEPWMPASEMEIADPDVRPESRDSDSRGISEENNDSEIAVTEGEPAETAGGHDARDEEEATSPSGEADEEVASSSGGADDGAAPPAGGADDGAAPPAGGPGRQEAPASGMLPFTGLGGTALFAVAGGVAGVLLGILLVRLSARRRGSARNGASAD